LNLQPLAELPGAEAGEEEARLAQRLAGERAPVDAGPAELLVLLDEDGLVPKVGGLRRPLLPGGPAADDDQLVVVFRLGRRCCCGGAVTSVGFGVAHDSPAIRVNGR